MDYEVRRGVPVPAGSGRVNKYPWAGMASGDCFDAELSDRSSVVNSGRQWLMRNRPGWRLVTRRVGDILRVWVVDPDNFS